MSATTRDPARKTKRKISYELYCLERLLLPIKYLLHFVVDHDFSPPGDSDCAEFLLTMNGI